KGVPSGVALIGIGCGRGNAKAENLIIVAPGANARLTPADVKKGMPTRLTRRDVVLCSLEIPMAAAIAAATWDDRKKAHYRILNPAPFPRTGLPHEIFERCNVITPNESEFELMASVDIMKFKPESFSSTFGTRHYFHIVVTRGAKGIVHVNPESSPSQMMAPRVKPVDTVGAGDCFNGSLAASFANRTSGIAALKFAVAAASLKVTRQGAQA